MTLITVEIDEESVREIALEQIREHIKNVEADLIFWDRRELERKTCMSWTLIQKEFFFHPDFPKQKVGSKWYFPAVETREFLLNWLKTKL